MKHAPIDLSNKGTTLGSLKEIVRRCDLMVTNDTGPRHIAAAFDVPVVTVFGPTHPEWTEIYYPRERQVAVKVFCGPCQKKICPLDHRCMTRVTPAMVFDASIGLLSGNREMAAGARPLQRTRINCGRRLAAGGGVGVVSGGVVESWSRGVFE